MAELLRTHPLQAWSAAFEQLPNTVGIAAEPFVAMVDVRLGAEAAARLDVDLPTVPNTWGPVGAGRAVWLGPDAYQLDSVALSVTPVDLFPNGFTSNALTVTLWARGYSRQVTMSRAGWVRAL